MSAPALLTLSHGEARWLFAFLDGHRAAGVVAPELEGVYEKLQRQVSRIERTRGSYG